MNISAKTEYACLAMMELAVRFRSAEPVRIRQIAERHGIPSRFLVQILLQLKNAGLVVSTRGSGGGYQLARDPSKITLADVFQAAEGSTPQEHPVAPDSPYQGVLASVWRDIARQRQQFLASVTLADLVERVSRTPQPMYYI